MEKNLLKTRSSVNDQKLCQNKSMMIKSRYRLQIEKRVNTSMYPNKLNHLSSKHNYREEEMVTNNSGYLKGILYSNYLVSHT